MPISTKPAALLVTKFLMEHPDMVAAFAGTPSEYTDWSDAPIAPISEQPEQIAPYVIYNYRISTGRDAWWMVGEVVTYWIYDVNVLKLSEIEKTMMHILRRYDDSAKEINTWAVDNDPDCGVQLHYVRHANSIEVIPMEDDFGVMGKAVMFEVGYVEHEGIGI